MIDFFCLGRVHIHVVLDLSFHGAFPRLVSSYNPVDSFTFKNLPDGHLRIISKAAKGFSNCFEVTNLNLHSSTSRRYFYHLDDDSYHPHVQSTHRFDVDPSSPSKAYYVARTAVNNLLPRPRLITSNRRPASAAAAAKSKIAVGACSNRRRRPNPGGVVAVALILSAYSSWMVLLPGTT